MLEQLLPISYATEKSVTQFDREFTERLVTFVPSFTEMKAKIIQGEDLSVGFGCLPKAHGDCTLGIATRLCLDNGFILYKTPSPFGLVIDTELPNEEKWKILDMPDIGKKQPFVVSVYLKTDSNFGTTYVDTNISTVSEKVIAGVVSHELAELRSRFGNPLPPEVTKLLNLYRASKGKFSQVDILPATETEVEFDLAASALGFRDEILEVARFKIERLHEYNKSTRTERGYDRHIAQQEFRKDVITQLTS